MINSKLSEALALLAAINPVSTATTVTSGWLDISQCHQVLGLIAVGVFGASATVDAKFQQANTSGGGAAKDVPNKAITQLLAAGGNNRQAEINLRPQDLDTENGFRWVQLSITVGTAASLVAGAVMAATRFEDAGALLNNASVAQVV